MEILKVHNHVVLVLPVACNGNAHFLSIPVNQCDDVTAVSRVWWRCWWLWTSHNCAQSMHRTKVMDDCLIDIPIGRESSAHITGRNPIILNQTGKKGSRGVNIINALTVASAFGVSHDVASLFTVVKKWLMTISCKAAALLAVLLMGSALNGVYYSMVERQPSVLTKGASWVRIAINHSNHSYKM